MESYRIENLSFSYPQAKMKVIDNLSLSINRGEFVTLCGSSGCGKTTLLRQLKTVLAPHGDRQGKIYFEGEELSSLDQRTQSAKIGFVMQSPDNQIVTDKVWHELAFGLESLGYDTPTIRLRVAEMASFFGIQNWFYKNVSELSGGQKQLLNLAAIMAMQPSVLILDEPTSQLDPIAASEFLVAIGKINRELGITVIMTEHRLEEVFPLADRVVVMDRGRIICDDRPREVGRLLKDKQHSMFLAMPVPMRICAEVDQNHALPVTVREGRKWLDGFAENNHLVQPAPAPDYLDHRTDKPLIEFDEVYFRYEREGPDIVKGLSMEIFPGEFYTILGGNGTGKSTTLSLMTGINKPYRGSVKIRGREISKIDHGQLFNKMLGVLPQDPQSIFVKRTVREDLLEILSKNKMAKEDREKRMEEIAGLCHITDLLSMHPYDLSGGEQQRAALAKVLLLEPKILVLDEPTKGMDAEFKQGFAHILYELLEKGVTVIMVSHDIEFSASYAHRCAMFFDGNIVSCDIPQKFFSNNSFYTSLANRMARHKLARAVTAEDVILACGGKGESFRIKPPNNRGPVESLWEEDEEVVREEKKLPFWRKLGASLALLSFLATLFLAVIRVEELEELGRLGQPALEDTVGAGNYWSYALIILALLVELFVLATILYGKKPALVNDQPTVEKRQLSKRTLAAMSMIFLAIPLTIYVGIYYFDDRKYYFISMLIILETMLPFVMIFEDSQPQARELIIIAVLCAIAVAGRAAFFMLPQFKPVVALVIIAGVALGGETGFLVGAVTGFVSNIFMGQGPWTPWQMFAFGIIGFLAGVLFRKGLLRRKTISLCIFGGLATFFVYGGIMNPAAVLMFQSRPTAQMFYLAYIKGIPFDLVHATATIVFLYFTAQPMLDKLDRIKLKYGLIEA